MLSYKASLNIKAHISGFLFELKEEVLLYRSISPAVWLPSCVLFHELPHPEREKTITAVKNRSNNLLLFIYLSPFFILRRKNPSESPFIQAFERILMYLHPAKVPFLFF